MASPLTPLYRKARRASAPKGYCPARRAGRRGGALPATSLLLHLLGGLLLGAAAALDVAARDVGLDVLGALVDVDRQVALLQLADADRHLGRRLAVDHVLQRVLRLGIELGARAFVDMRGLRHALRRALDAHLHLGLVARRRELG